MHNDTDVRRPPARRCRQCGGPLAATRYFKCSECLPELESEDRVFEGVESLEYGSGLAAKAIRKRLATQCPYTKPVEPTRLCKGCGLIKPVGAFPTLTRGDWAGPATRCGTCKYQHEKKMREAARVLPTV